MDAQTGVRPTVPGGRPVLRRLGLAEVAAAIALVAVFVAATSLVALPPTVDRVTMINPTEFALNVEVNGGGSGAWSPVGIVEQRSTQVAEDVLDQGDVWEFRFAGQGRDAGELRLTRDQLQDADWTLEIPGAVGERLRGAGAPPSP